MTSGRTAPLHRVPRYVVRRPILWILLLAVTSAMGPPAPATGTPHPPATLWLEEGTRLWSQPGGTGRPLARLDSLSELSVLEVRDGWARVHFGSVTGWVALPTEPEATAVEVPLVPRAADPQRLARAKAILGAAGSTPWSGALPLYTDVSSIELLAFLQPLLDHLPAAYRERYGLDPTREPVEVLVLFRRDEDLDNFLAATGDPRRVVDGGFTHKGIAVSSVGDRSSEAVARNLIHEAVHLLNRRVFTLPPPIWIEEGMANDLAYSRFTEDGGIVLGSLGGTSRAAGSELLYNQGGWLELGHRVDRSGPIASLTTLYGSFRPTDLQPLMVLDTDAFFAPEGRQRRYDLATFLVRYLLDGATQPVRTAFRAYLQSLAQSTEPPPPLEEALGRSPWDLGEELAGWLAALLREGTGPTARPDRHSPPPRPAPHREGTAPGV